MVDIAWPTVVTRAILELGDVHQGEVVVPSSVIQRLLRRVAEQWGLLPNRHARILVERRKRSSELSSGPQICASGYHMVLDVAFEHW